MIKDSTLKLQLLFLLQLNVAKIPLALQQLL